MNINKKVIISGIILFVILGLFIYMYTQKEGVFAKYDTVVYPDGCKETFKNGVAITPLCTAERVLMDGQTNGTT